MITVADIAWLAGLLEGEGYFQFSSDKPRTKSFRITLDMSDKDVVERAALLMSATVSPVKINSRFKPRWRFSVIKGSPQWLMTLYPLMGRRRQARIREMLTRWREPVVKVERTHCQRGHPFPPKIGPVNKCTKCHADAQRRRAAIGKPPTTAKKRPTIMQHSLQSNGFGLE